MAAEDKIQINGNAHSHASVKIYIGGDPTPYSGVKSINYSHKLEPGEYKGTNAQITRRTLGEYSTSGDIEMRIDEANRLITNMGDGYMAVSLNIVVSRFEQNMDSIIDELIGVRITESNTQSSEGKDATTRKFTLHILVIRENGILPIPDMVIPELDVALHARASRRAVDIT